MPCISFICSSVPSEAYRDIAEVWKGFFSMQQNANNKVVLKALASYEMLESHEKIQFDALMMALMVTVEISIEVADQSFIVAEQIDPAELYVGRFFNYAGTWSGGEPQSTVVHRLFRNGSMPALLSRT
jgi:hypothetical protein